MDTPVLRVVGWTKRRRHPYGIMMYTQLSFIGLRELEARLSDGSIGMQAMRVLTAMIAACDYENVVHKGQKDLARELEMAQQHVSRAVRALLECGFLEQPGSSRGYYVVSPRLCWKGGEESLRRALAERKMLDKDGYLCPAAA